MDNMKHCLNNYQLFYHIYLHLFVGKTALFSLCSFIVEFYVFTLLTQYESDSKRKLKKKYFVFVGVQLNT